MFDWIAEMIGKGGYLGLAFLMFLENVFPPIPSELVMPMGGYLADTGELSFWPVVLAGTLGSVVGQVALYYVGRGVGEERLKRWSEEHGHWVATSPEEIDRAKNWMQRKRGGTAILLGRMVPGIRSLISIPAGVVRMPMSSFLTCTVIGTFTWTLALAYAGLLIGQHFEKVEAILNPVAYTVIGLCVGGYLYRVIKGFRRGHGDSQGAGLRARSNAS